MDQAKKLISLQQKDRALIVLKLRRFKDNEANKVDGELMSVLEMIENVEWEHANMEVLRALKAGTASLNKLHEEMSMDDVADLLEETNQAIEVRSPEQTGSQYWHINNSIYNYSLCNII